MAAMVRENKGQCDPERISEFAALLGRHQRQIYVYILSLMPRPVDADDVLQETNVVLWSKFHEYQPGTNFATWACQVARFKVLQHLQRSHRRPVLMDVDLLSQLASDAEQMSGELEGDRQRLDKCIQQLTPEDRFLILRRYSVGETGKSVANYLGRPTNSVYQSLSRIRRRLFECVHHARTVDLPPGGDS
jgi:RNA polymerase sigma-70 factor, ECF subfamily